MRIKGKRRSKRLGLLRFNRVGLRLTSITVNLGPLWTGVLWERAK